MRSDFDTFGALVRQASDPANPHRLLAANELEMLARHHRAMMLGEAIAGAIVWLVRLPSRLVAAVTAPPARRARVRG